MTGELKDSVQIVIMNTTAIGFSVTDCNEILTLVSLILAISISVYKLYTWTSKK